MDITATHIETLLIEADIEGLIAAGAPRDEYEYEARQIAEAMNMLEGNDVNEEHILSIIGAVWMNSFNLGEKEMVVRAANIRDVAGKVLSMYASR